MYSKMNKLIARLQFLSTAAIRKHDHDLAARIQAEIIYLRSITSEREILNAIIDDTYCTYQKHFTRYGI